MAFYKKFEVPIINFDSTNITNSNMLNNRPELLQDSLIYTPNILNDYPSNLDRQNIYNTFAPYISPLYFYIDQWGEKYYKQTGNKFGPKIKTISTENGNINLIGVADRIYNSYGNPPTDDMCSYITIALPMMRNKNDSDVIMPKPSYHSSSYEGFYLSSEFYLFEDTNKILLYHNDIYVVLIDKYIYVNINFSYNNINYNMTSAKSFIFKSNILYDITKYDHLKIIIDCKEEYIYIEVLFGKIGKSNYDKKSSLKINTNSNFYNLFVNTSYFPTYNSKSTLLNNVSGYNDYKTFINSSGIDLDGQMNINEIAGWLLTYSGMGVNSSYTDYPLLGSIPDNTNHDIGHMRTLPCKTNLSEFLSPSEIELSNGELLNPPSDGKSGYTYYIKGNNVNINENNIQYTYLKDFKFLLYFKETVNEILLNEDILKPISISIPYSTYTDILNPISLDVENDFIKSLKQVEDYINKTYLGDQRSADDFQLLMKVTDTSYWPVEFCIDNNYHIHIKPDPIYLGVELYVCTNKQFLYQQYKLT